MKLRDKELVAAKYLELRHVMISWPGDGIEESGLKWHWGVCVGSHGGYAKTLRGAMRACLRCCGIGAWWKVNPPHGLKLKTLFERASSKYLGRSLF